MWKNQSQLLGALVAYSTQYEVAYPGPIDPAIGVIADAHQARLVTAQMLGILARSESLPLSLLTCPDSKLPKLKPFAGDRVPVSWAIEPGSALYALDWATPQDPGSERVVMADRDPTAHSDGVLAVFGDAHVKKLRFAAKSATRPVGVLITEGPDGKPIGVTVSVPARKPDAYDTEELPLDDIYTDAGDHDLGIDSLVPENGHSLRAWVK